MIPDVETAIRDLLERRGSDGTAHWPTCYGEHVDCAARVLFREIDRLQEDLEQARLAYDSVSKGRHALRAIMDAADE